MVEGVATATGLAMDGSQVRVHGRARLGMRLESLELWVIGVAARLTAEHRLCKEGLAPKCDKSLRI